MVKNLLASDYDGTLRRLKRIASSDIKAIKKWQSHGRRFGIVTGRGRDFFETVKEIKIKPDFLILYNGALIADGNGCLLHEELICRDVYKELEELFKQNTDGIISYSKADNEDFYYQYCAKYNNYERSLEVAKIVNSTLGDKVTAVVNGQHIDIDKKGVSKANGVRFILSHFGLDESECAVVGDDYNDLDMINQLDGWAMITGKKEVRTQANHVCFSVGSLANKLMK